MREVYLYYRKFLPIEHSHNESEQQLTDIELQDGSHEMEVDNQDQVAAAVAVDQHPDSSAHQQQQQQQQQPLTPQEHRSKQ